MVKPIVAVDVDGTLSEYHLSLARHICQYFDLQTGFEPWDGKGNYEDYFGITQTQYREAKLAYRQGGFKRWSPEQPGVRFLRDCLSSLRDCGLIEVWITTTRPWNRLDSVDPDTRFWLDRHFPVYDHLLYHDYKYPELATLVDPERVIGVIDDLPEMVMAAKQTFAGASVYMVHRHHNIGVHPALARLSLEEFSLEIEKKVEEWWSYETSSYK